MNEPSPKQVAFSSQFGSAYFVERKLRVTLLPIAFLYLQELARKVASQKTEFLLPSVRHLDARQAAVDYMASMPCLNGTLMYYNAAARASLYNDLFGFVLARKSCDGLVGPYFTGLVDAAMRGDTAAVHLGLELWRELQEQGKTIFGPLGAVVFDCDHGEVHFLDEHRIGTLADDLPKLTKIKQTLPKIPQVGGGGVDKDIMGILEPYLSILGPEYGLGARGTDFDPEGLADLSLDDLMQLTRGTDPFVVPDSTPDFGLGPLSGPGADDRPTIPAGRPSTSGGDDPGYPSSSYGHELPGAGEGGLDPRSLPKSAYADGGDAPAPAQTPSEQKKQADEQKKQADEQKADEQKADEQKKQADEQRQHECEQNTEISSALVGFGVFGLVATLLTGGGAALGILGVAIGGGGLGFEAGKSLEKTRCAPTRMEDPNNPTTAIKDDPLMGIWKLTNTVLAGAAINGRILRRRGCYVIPTRYELHRLIGGATILERAGLKGVDIGWGVEQANTPPPDVDWRRVLRQRRDWIAQQTAAASKT
jgi:hypothetical protein